MAYLLGFFNPFQGKGKGEENSLNLGLVEGNILPGPGGMGFQNKPKEIPVSGTHAFPILEGLPEEKQGVVVCDGQNIFGANLDHIFSFTYYLPEGNVFENSPYYYGLKAYIEIAHGIFKINEVPFPYRCGVIIYTDIATLRTLVDAFPFEQYPNLTIALVEWPFFTTSEGNLSNTVMRTLRYHAVEHFKTKNVHMRDADTLFVVSAKEIRNSSNAYHTRQFQEIVYNWEAKYLATLPLIQAKGKQIVFGSYYGYSATYHKNLPYPIAFQFPFRSYEEYHVYDVYIPDQYLYVKSKYYPSHIKYNLDDTYSNIRQKYTSNESKLKYKADPEIRKRILNLWKKREQYHYSDKKYEETQNEIDRLADEVKENMKRKIPEDVLLATPFFMKLGEFMKKGSPAVYAGFVSVLQNRKGIEDFWRLCVMYLLSRYKMVDDIETGRKVVSNETLKEQKVSVLAVGKDERMLMYGVAPTLLDHIFVFPINYSMKKRNVEHSKLYDADQYFSSEIVRRELNGNQPDFSLTKSFMNSTREYQHWLQDFYKTYPTENDFLNAVDKILTTELITPDRLDSSRIRRINAPHANPYAYPPLVRRGGRTRKRGSKRKSKTRKH